MGQRLDELMEKAATVPVLRSGAERSLVAQKAEGARVFDVDNAGYIDYLAAGGATLAISSSSMQFVRYSRLAFQRGSMFPRRWISPRPLASSFLGCAAGGSVAIRMRRFGTC